MRGALGGGRLSHYVPRGKSVGVCEFEVCVCVRVQSGRKFSVCGFEFRV